MGGSVSDGLLGYKRPAERLTLTDRIGGFDNDILRVTKIVGAVETAIFYVAGDTVESDAVMVIFVHSNCSFHDKNWFYFLP